ncbi:HNH endonuclease signature motif containing protein [Tsukamurella pseudospumae]|nr:HNH endonuclease signature motif containing protein [Tsukamurella pseudospumae]
MTAVYALHRALYADDEAQYLARPANYREAVEARQRLAAAEVALSAQISTLLRLGSTAAVHVVEVAVGLIERLPKVFGLIGENVITPKAAEIALGRSRVLSASQVRDLDAALHDRLTVDYEVLAIPALREQVDLLVGEIDPEAAERRRKLAEQDRKVTFRPADDGMAMAFALLPSPDMQDIAARVEYIATTVCDDDPRTVAQRQGDGLAQLIRGYSTLGCACTNPDCKYRTARFHGEPDADGVITRFVTLINVVINETDLADPDTPDQGAPEQSVPEDSSAADSHADKGAAGASAADDEGAQADAVARADADAGVDADAAADSASNPAPGRRGGLAYLEGHGPISLALARALAAREDAVIRPFGRRITDHDDAAGLSSRAACDASSETEPRGAIDFQWAWRDIVARLEGHDDPGGTGFDFGPDDHGPDDGAPDGNTSPDDESPDDGDPDDGGLDDGHAGDTYADDDESDDSGMNDSDQLPVEADPVGAPPALVRARGSSGYRPSADLRRYLRLIHPRCVFPHCNRPAARAQIDHRREYDHTSPELGGQTTAEQIQPLCISHHQLKTAGEWIDARLPDGRILWTSPHGRHYIVDPTGIILTLFPDLARVEWVIPAASGSGSEDHVSAAEAESPARPGGRTRLQREHARRERRRRDNITAYEAEQNRKSLPVSEIEAGMMRVIGAPTPRSAPSFDGPLPF